MAKQNSLNNDSSTFTVDNALTVTAGGAAITGNSTINGGTVGIGSDAADNTISIATSASAGRTLNLGNTTGTSGIIQRVGTGNYSLDGAAGSTYAIGASTTTGTITLGGASMTGTLTLGNSTSGQTVNIVNTAAANTVNIVAAGATTASTVNIATGAAAHALNLGGTNSTATTAIKSGTGGISLATGTTGAIAINPGTTGAVTLGTTSTGNVSIGNTTGTTSIQFGTGSALSTFADWTSWTPTIVGGSTAGTATYSVQSGYYSRIGNIVVVEFFVGITAHTGTGDLRISSLPFTINAASNNYVSGSVDISGSALTWPTGTTMLTLRGAPGVTYLILIGSGTLSSGSPLQIASTTCSFVGTITYRV